MVDSPGHDGTLVIWVVHLKMPSPLYLTTKLEHL